MRTFVLWFYWFTVFISTVTAQDDLPPLPPISELENYSFEKVDSLTKLYGNANAYEHMLACAKIGEEKAAQKFGKKDSTYARMVYYIGLYHHHFRDHETARTYYQQVLDIERSNTKKSTRYMSYLHQFGVMSINSSWYDNAAALYTELVKLQGAKYGKDSVYAEYQNMLAVIYYFSGDYDKATKQYENVLETQKNALGEQHISYIKTLHNLAIIYMDMGLYSQAESLYHSTKRKIKAVVGENDRVYASCLHNLAMLYVKMGRYEAAEPLYLKAMKVRKAVLGEEHSDYAVSLNNLATLYSNMGRYEEAKLLYLESMDIRRKVWGPKHLNYAASLHNLALHYVDFEEYAAAEPLLKEALKIWKESLGRMHPEYAYGLQSYANLQNNLKNYKEAERLHQEVVAIRKVLLGEEHPDYLQSKVALAQLYISMKRLKEAEALNTELVEKYAQALGTRHPDYIQFVCNMGILYYNVPDDAKAWATLLKAIELNTGVQQDTLQVLDAAWGTPLKKTNCVDVEKMLLTLEVMYDILDAQKASNPAVKTQQLVIVDLAMHVLKRSRDEFALGENKLRNLSTCSDWVMRSLHTLGEKEVEAAFVYAEQNKSVLLLEASNTERAYTFGNLPDELMTEEQELQANRDYYKAQLLEQETQEQRDSLYTILNDLNIEIDQFKDKIEKNYPEYVALKYESKQADIKTIQASLDAKSALLEYVVGDSNVYVFYIDQQQSKLTHFEIQKTVLDKKVEQLQKALSNYQALSGKPEQAYVKYTNVAYWFYENLVAPSLKEAKDIEHLIVITDGKLGYLPFETFLVERAPQQQTDYQKLHYLMTDYKISYNYSATLWEENKRQKRPSNNRQLLALAADYNLKQDSMAERLPLEAHWRSLLPPLPNAQKEVEVLSEAYQGYFCQGIHATERFFKEKAGDYAVIHLAMHGLLNEQSPILSSLAFTEDSDSLENNFLQAYEISKLQLNADLVVLSACETGYGKFEAGNGIASLARAFMYAGASSLVVSLWQVNDYSTAMIMRAFYQNLSEGMDKAEALRAAKFQYLKENQAPLNHPAFWSPFIQLGNSQNIQIREKGADWLLYAGVAGMLMLLFAFLSWRVARLKDAVV